MVRSIRKGSLGARTDAVRCVKMSRSLLASAIALLATTQATAQTTVGPGPVPAPVVVPGGTTTDVAPGTTITSTDSSPGASISGTLNMDGSSGPILVQTTNGVALNVLSGGTLNILGGVTLTTTNVGTAVLVSGGTASVAGLTINNVSTALNGGHGIIANPGASVTVGAGTSITTSANNAMGLAANNGGTLTLTAPVSVTGGRLDGIGAFGLYVRGTGSVVSSPALGITLTGRQMVGITSNSASLPAGSIGAGTTVTLNAGNVAGAGGTGVMSINGGTLALENLNVNGTAVSSGAWASGAGSVVSLSGTSTIAVSTAANPAYSTVGLWTATGTPSFTGASAFSNAAGLLATLGGTVISTGTTVDVPVSAGAGLSPASGAHAANGSLIDMTGNTITTSGTSSFGLRLDAARIVARDSRIATSGGGAAVFLNSAVSSVDLVNTTTRATGAGTAALYANNFATAGTNVANISGGSLTSEQDLAIGATGPMTVAISGGATVSGPTLLVGFDQIPSTPTFTPQPTLLQVTASGASRLSGDAFAEPASTVNLSLAGASTWTGASAPAEPISNVTVDSTSTWSVTGDSVLTQTLTHAGLVDFAAPVGGLYKTLTVRDYVGQGGTLALNTFLGDDASPSDRLVIDGGAATGEGVISIKPTGGAGALTVANGILVVDAVNGGTTAADMFALSRRVIAGPYEYTLQRSGVDGSAPQSWFLRSVLDCSIEGAPVPPCPQPPPPDPDPDPDPGPDPDPDPPPEPPVPNYRDEVSLYSSAIPTAMHYGRSLLDTLHERVGEQELLHGRADLGQDRNALDGMWGRLLYVDGERDSRLGIYGDGPSYDYTLAALQLGVDLYRSEEQDGRRDHAGLYGAVGQADTEVRHYDGTSAGDDRIDAYTLGGYWTRYGLRDGDVRRQWYLDTVLQASWFDVSAVPDEDLPRMETDGWGLGVSVEGGYPFRLRDDWTLEPQAQVVYQWFDFDDASDAAASVRFDDTDSLVGRLSARLSRDWIHREDAVAPLSTTAWGRVGVWHEFRGEPVTAFSSDDGFIPFRADLGGTWWELELGGTRELDRNVFLYGNVGYSQGFDDDRRSWEGKLGLRANW